MRSTSTIRRLMALGSSLLTVAVVAACSSNTAAPNSTSETTDVGKPEGSIYCGEKCQAQLKLEAAPSSISCSVGVSWNSASHPYGAKHTQEIAKYAAQFFPGMKVTVADAQGDGGKQSGQVDDMVAQKIDVLVVSPADAAGLSGAVQRAEAAGVKVIAADRSVDTDVSTYIGSDNVEAGTVAGQALVQALNDQGTVIELAGSLGASPTIDRAKGFRDALASSGVEIIATQTANYDHAEGLKVMEDFLQRFGEGEIDAVYAHNDQMAFGAIQAIEEAGRADEIKVFGIDGELGALKDVQAGTYTATVGYPAVVQEVALAAAKLCAGESIDERIVLDSTLIDKSNVDLYISNPPQ